MFRIMMKSKIHRATVTEADLQYMGSITIDQDILDEVDIFPNEKVQIVNNHNGARFETYVISGPSGSGTICLNGAAARLVQPGDEVIIISYMLMENQQMAFTYSPKIAIMDKENRIEKLIHEEVPHMITTGEHMN